MKTLVKSAAVAVRSGLTLQDKASIARLKLTPAEAAELGGRMLAGYAAPAVTPAPATINDVVLTGAEEADLARIKSLSRSPQVANLMLTTPGKLALLALYQKCERLIAASDAALIAA